MTKFSVNLTCVAASKCKHSLVTTGVSVSLIAINTVSLLLLPATGHTGVNLTLNLVIFIAPPPRQG